MNKAIAYAQDMLTFLFLDAGVKNKIKRIYLFGSAVRGTLEKDSDIDIFIDCEEAEQIEKITKSAITRFTTSKDFDKWKLFKFTYPFSVQAGNIMEWELKTSIIAEGILLYSRKAEITPEEIKVMFIIKLPKKKNKYLQFTRTAFGRKEKGYLQKGVLDDCQRISSNIFISPKIHQQKIMQFLNEQKIDFEMKEIGIV